MEAILKTDNISKIYRNKKAVDNVSLTVKKGDIYGFVGLNGSGKTTFIRLVTSLIKSSGGSYSLFGATTPADNRKALKKVSSMVETPTIYMNMTALDNLRVQCDIVCEKDAGTPKRLLDLVGLDISNKQKAKNYSLGMRQRLGIAMALVGDPELLLLDEPTNGLDPEGIVDIRELLLKLNREKGITILISSHILVELSKLANTYGFIHNGKLILEATNEEILAKCDTKITLSVDNTNVAMAMLSEKYKTSINGSNIEIYEDVPITDIVMLLSSAGIIVKNANKSVQDLEGFFINLIGRHS